MEGVQLCEFCGDVFSSQEFVIHTYNNGLLEGPYLCELCGDGFNSRCQVDLHYQEQHAANRSKKICTDKPCNFHDCTLFDCSSSEQSSSSSNSVLRTPSQAKELSHNKPLFLEARAHASFMPKQKERENQAIQQISRPLFLDARSFASFIPNHEEATANCSKSPDGQPDIHNDDSHSRVNKENGSQPVVTNQEICFVSKEREVMNDNFLSENSLDKFLHGTDVRENGIQGVIVSDAQSEDKLTLSNNEIQIKILQDIDKTAISGNESLKKVYEEKETLSLQRKEFHIEGLNDNIEEIDIKPVICNICKVAFNNTDDITVHIDCFHGDYPYKCVMCYSVYRTFTEINEHLTTEHKIKKENLTDNSRTIGHVSIRKETQCHGHVMDTNAVATGNQASRDMIGNIMLETVNCNTVSDFDSSAKVDTYMAQINNVVASCVSDILKNPVESHQIMSAEKNIQVVIPECNNCANTNYETDQNVKRTRGRNACILNRQMINVDAVVPLPVIYYTCTAICYMCTGERSVRFGCLICPKIFFTCTEVMYHQNNVHKTEVYGGKDKNVSGQTYDGVYVHACNACNAVFHNLEGLISHDLDNHLKITQYKCKFSKQEFKSKEEFFTHFKLSIMKNLASTCPVTYINNKKYLSTNLNFCPICGSSILDYAHFKTHVQRLHIGVPQQLDCWICGDSLCGESHKDNHITTLHKDRSSYICILCNTRFSKIADLQHHHDNTHNHHENIFTCTICNSVVKCTYMKQHYEVDHGITKLYDCKFCNDVFLDSSARKLHQDKIHNVHESYKCHICQEVLANFQHFHLHFHSKHLGNFCNCFNIVANLVYSFSK